MTKREIVTDLNDNQRICIKTCLDFPISTFLFTLLLGENSGNRENLHDRLLRNVYMYIHTSQLPDNHVYCYKKSHKFSIFTTHNKWKLGFLCHSPLSNTLLYLTKFVVLPRFTKEVNKPIIRLNGLRHENRSRHDKVYKDNNPIYPNNII